MEVKASLKHLRMSPQKVRLVIDVVRKMPVDKALDQLQFMNKLAASSVKKLIGSAIANAISVYDLDRSNLYIKEIRSDEGVMLKRWSPRAHGRATSIRKRGCHISLTLGEIKDGGHREKKKVEAAEPVKLEKLAKEGEKTAVKANAEDKKARPKAETGAKGFTAKTFRRKSG
jgi:large subunit ribosomal protein L22